VGGGGREHALSWAIRRSPDVDRLFVAPGNGGTQPIAENVAIDGADIEALAAFARESRVGLTVVGPEAPLVAGIVDHFQKAGLRIFGPRRSAAQLEGSKVFAKRFMKRHGIPTGDFEVFDSPDRAKAHVAAAAFPVVIKADGLAQGKGVVVARSREEAVGAVDHMMVEKAFGESGRQVMVEEYLTGEEVSVHAVCAGEKAVLLPVSQDHKRALDGDRGPNTGGMGAYAPTPFVDDATREAIRETVILRTLRGMQTDGNRFDGVLYAGMILTEDGPKVLEFNVRFGDPETQVLLPLLASDLLHLLHGAAGGDLPRSIETHAGRFAATVVMTAAGYPGAYGKGDPIQGIEEVETPTRVAFHAGTARRGNDLVTSGGRVLAVTAWANDLASAVRNAYDGVGTVRFSGARWRTDIARKALV
jgi:phosphoribosylamine--glycine ligase